MVTRIGGRCITTRTIESAVKSAYRHFQNTQDANGVLEIMEGSKRLLDQFTAILSPKFTVIEK